MNVYEIGRSSDSLSSIAFPLEITNSGIDDGCFCKAYSYGDSAGFTPGFPFHSFSGNQLRTKLTKSTPNFV
jgi:hypothetical protein